MKGLNKLKGFSLSGMKLAKEAPDGTNTEGQVLIPNPSVMTISLVCTTFESPPNSLYDEHAY